MGAKRLPKEADMGYFTTRLFTGAKDTQRIALEQTLEIAVVVSRSLLFAVQ